MNAKPLLLLAVFAVAASGDSGAAARADYESARAAVQEFEDAALEASSSSSTPDLVARARELGAKATAAVARCRESIAAGEKDGSLGRHSVQFLREFLRELERDLGVHEASLPPAPEPADAAPGRPGTPEAEETAADKRAWQEQLREIEKFAEEADAAWQRAEQTYGYDAASATLQESYDRAGAKDTVGQKGQFLWSHIYEKYGSMKQAAGATTSLARQARKAPLDAAYMSYLRSFMRTWRRDRSRFFDLARRTIDAQTRVALAWDQARREGKLSFEAPEIGQAEAAVNTLFAAINAPALLPLPISQAEWEKLKPQARRRLAPGASTGLKGSSFDTWEGRAEAAGRGQALGELWFAFKDLKERVAAGEVPRPGELQALIESLDGVLGDKFEKLQPVMAAVAEKLETAQEVVDFLEAVNTLVRAVQHRDDDAVQPLRDLRSFIQGLKPFVGKVPGIGGILDYYDNSLGLAADQLAEVDRVTRERRRAANDAWTQAVEGLPTTELDSVLGDIDAGAPDLPDDFVLPEPAEPAGPELSPADRVNIDRGSAAALERFRRAKRIEGDIFLGLAYGRDRVASEKRALADLRARAAASPADTGLQAELHTLEGRVRETDSEWARAVENYREARENVDATRRAYEEKVAELTRMALEGR